MGYTLTGAALLGLAGLDVCFSFVPAATFRPEFASSLRFSQKSSTSNKGRGTNPGERRSRAAAAVGPVQATQKSKEEQESDVFDWLASNAGVDKIVSLGTVAGGGHRGLVMNSDVEEGQVVLEVPSDVCLWSTRDGVVSGLLGQTDMCWEAAGDLREAVSDDDYARGLTWDVRLAVALLEATSDPQIGGKFWDVYGRMLPQPHTIAVPFCLPERLLTQLHNDGMAKRAAKQVDRLRSIYPDLMRSLLSHPKTAIYAAGKTKEAGGGGEAVESDVSPMALVWAFAMVRSRAFTSNDDRFALVPFLDMANHGFSPSTNFTYEEPGVYRLRAMRDMRAGEEATISYGEDLNADQLMVQYGFPVPTELPLARPLGDTDAVQNRASAAAKAERDSGVGSVADEATPEEGAAAAEGEGEEWGEVARRSLMDEMFMLGQQRFAREAGSDSLKFETLVRRALPLIPPIATAIGESRGGGGATEGAKAYLEELLAYRTANFPSTEEQDKELLRYCLGDGRGKVDQRLADVVRYRLARKEAHSLAVDILEEYLAPPPPPPPPAPPVVEDAAEDGREEAESSPVESDDAAQRTEA